jgi:large-conductance mechanosensitive channel
MIVVKRVIATASKCATVVADWGRYYFVQNFWSTSINLVLMALNVAYGIVIWPNFMAAANFAVAGWVLAFVIFLPLYSEARAKAEAAKVFDHPDAIRPVMQAVLLDIIRDMVKTGHLPSDFEDRIYFEPPSRLH